MDEKAWEDAATVADFFQVLPMDTSKAAVKTEVKLCYDSKFLYVLFINYDTIPGPYMIESMKRDWNFGKNDNDLLFLDTYNDQTTGFSFGSNAVGGQWDGLMSSGSRIDLSWDNKWYSETTSNDDLWIWEAAIPFKTIRYKKDVSTWGINFSRNDLKSTEKSSWTPIPRQFPTASLAFTGNLVWDSLPPKPGANISIIPYALAKATKPNAASPFGFDNGIGFDAKIGLSSATNLDLTVNPDFSQVDVDVQQTNLDRFELFFPERRQFFLENGDLFNNFGYNNIRPFFSRRIGLNAPILYGGRFSGKLTDKIRMGAMSIQTGENDQQEAGSLFSVFALQHRVFKRSYITGMFINKDLIDKNPDQNAAAYNRSIGLEYNLASDNNIWLGKIFYLNTFSPLANKNSGILAGNLSRNTRRLSLDLQVESVGENVQGNEVGYIQRQNYVSAKPQINYLFFPKNGQVLSHGPGMFYNGYFERNTGKQFEYLLFMNYLITMKDRSQVMLWTAHDYVKLQNEYDPFNFNQYFLAKNQEHHWQSAGLNYDSKPQKLFTYNISTRFGGYYANGERIRLDWTAGYRFQPYVLLQVSSSYNRIMLSETDARLPKELLGATANLWLVGPKLDVTLSNKMFFSNFLQYNKQSNNLNFYSRFQWRYSPASDLFLVYTDNYLAENLHLKNRTLVLKFTYWWNV